MHIKKKELVGIFTSLLADLSMAVTVLKDYEDRAGVTRPKNELHRQCIWRLCFHAIVINCYKYVEVNNKYGKELHSIIPEMATIKNRFVKEINDNRAITELRNDYVAHIMSDSKKRALTDEEVQYKIITMMGGGNASTFLDWVCPDNIEHSELKDSLVGTIQLLRDAISVKL